MKNIQIKNRGVLIGLALSCTVLIMVPLITGAAPTSAPPSPNLPDANFNSVNSAGLIKNANLEIAQDGTISSPTGSVTFQDFQGVVFKNPAGISVTQLFSNGGIISNTSTSEAISVAGFSSNGTGVYGDGLTGVTGNGGITGKGVVGLGLTAGKFKYSNCAFSKCPTTKLGTADYAAEFGNDSGITNLGIALNGDINNPTANPVMINDANGVAITDPTKTGYPATFYIDNTYGPAKYFTDDYGSTSKIIANTVTEKAKCENGGGFVYTSGTITKCGTFITFAAHLFGFGRDGNDAGLWIRDDGKILGQELGHGTDTIGLLNDQGVEIANGNGTVGLKIDDDGRLSSPIGAVKISDNLEISGKTTATGGFGTITTQAATVFTLLPATFGGGSAYCPSGTYVINCGYWYDTAPGGTMQVYDLRALSDQRCWGRALSSVARSFSVYPTCWNPAS